MGILPAEIYRAVEAALYGRRAELAEARFELTRARAAASDAHAPAFDQQGHGSPRQDKLERAVIRLDEAEERCRRAALWAQALDRTDQLMDERERMIITELYTDRIQQQQVAEDLGVDRQTVRRVRDKYAAHAAIIAAELGLVTMGGGDGVEV